MEILKGAANAALKGPRGIVYDAFHYRRFGIGPLLQFVLWALLVYSIGIGMLHEGTRFVYNYYDECQNQIEHSAVHEDCYYLKSQGRSLSYQPGTIQDCQWANYINTTTPLWRAWTTTLGGWSDPLSAGTVISDKLHSWEGKFMVVALLGLLLMAAWNSTKSVRRQLRDFFNWRREMYLLQAAAKLNLQDARLPLDTVDKTKKAA